MSSEMRWRVYVKNLETRVRIGIHAHEQEPQRILINASIEGTYPVYARSIGDCFNYDHIHHLAVQEWPRRPHVHLLEMLVVDMLHYIFSIDERVDYAKVSLSKPDIFREAESVGVEAEWSRNDFRGIHAARPK